MAVYTKVSETDLAAFLKNYALGDVKHFEPILEGVENSNYRLATTVGEFILTLFEGRTSVDDLPYFIDVMTHSAIKDIPCPHPISDKAGQILKTLCGKTAALFSALPGQSELEPSSQHCETLGAMLAKLHLANESLDSKRANSLGAESWRALVEKVGEKAEKIEPGLLKETLAEIDFISHHWPRHLPTGAVHADLFPDNVLWEGERLTGLIDFYFSCTDCFAYDIAVCIASWCFSGDQHFSKPHAQAMLQGYESVRPLNHAEHDALNVLCRGAAMRFFVTRLYDLFFTPADALVSKKDPSAFLKRSRYFRAHAVIDIAA